MTHPHVGSRAVVFGLGVLISAAEMPPDAVEGIFGLKDYGIN